MFCALNCLLVDDSNGYSKQDLSYRKLVQFSALNCFLVVDANGYSKGDFRYGKLVLFCALSCLLVDDSNGISNSLRESCHVLQVIQATEELPRC